MTNNQQKEEWCGWCIRHPRAIANSGYEQQNTSGEWKGLCKRCASRRLNNPYNALLNIRKSLMPNNEQKEEVKCERCRDTKKDSCGFLCWDCSKPESMVTTLEEDRKLLKQYPAVTSDLLAGMLICNRDWQAWELGTMTEDDFFDASEDDDSVGQIDTFIEKLLAAKERVVRAECAEIVNKIEKRIEGDRTVRLGFVLSEIDEAKSKILNNSPL